MNRIDTTDTVYLGNSEATGCIYVYTVGSILDQ